MAKLLTPDERATLRQSEHDCNCAVCDDLVERYEATACALEAERADALAALEDVTARYRAARGVLARIHMICRDGPEGKDAFEERDAVQALAAPYAERRDG